ncbi:MAG TPA: hypothetical protein VH913_04585 [Hyphomicrobiaceae bacterium]
MRPPAAVCLGLAASLGLLLAVAPAVRADSDCQVAFGRWAKISGARVVPSAASGRGACLPSEEVRTGLLEGLARTRGICAESGSDQGVQQTRTLLSINEGFIASLGICTGSDGAAASADAGGGWVTRAAPSLEKPRAAAPLPFAPPSPPPPPRVVVAPAPPVAPPPPVPPRPGVFAAPAPAAPAAVAPGPGPAPAPPCLEIVAAQSVSPAQGGNFALVNRRCRGYTVLAVIETQAATGETVCTGHAIGQGLTVRAPLATPPRINYECVSGQGPCTKARLGDMFPECDW